jgi:hypothetical protein
MSSAGRDVINHAGTAALRLIANRTGLTAGLSWALARRGFAPVHDRGRAGRAVGLLRPAPRAVGGDDPQFTGWGNRVGVAAEGDQRLRADRAGEVELGRGTRSAGRSAGVRPRPGRRP